MGSTIDRQSGRLSELIHDQYDALHASGAVAVEAVGARVVRAAGFLNRGEPASGHLVPVDEPSAFGGTGSAADPAELLLVAIGASLSVTLTVHAALAGIRLDAVSVSLSGKLDPRRFFDPIDAPGGGFNELVAEVELASAAPRSALDALLGKAVLASPVLRSIAPAPDVRLRLRECGR